MPMRHVEGPIYSQSTQRLATRKKGWNHFEICLQREFDRGLSQFLWHVYHSRRRLDHFRPNRSDHSTEQWECPGALKWPGERMHDLRTPCVIRWTNLEHPRVLQPAWTSHEWQSVHKQAAEVSGVLSTKEFTCVTGGAERLV